MNNYTPEKYIGYNDKLMPSCVQIIVVKDTPRYIYSGSVVEALDVNKDSPLLLAVKHNHATVVELLLRWNAKLRNDKNGNKPISVAAYLGYTELVKYLAQYCTKEGK